MSTRTTRTWNWIALGLATLGVGGCVIKETIDNPLHCANNNGLVGRTAIRWSTSMATLGPRRTALRIMWERTSLDPPSGRPLKLGIPP